MLPVNIETHNKVTGFSGNEIFCLKKLGYRAGQLCLGNSVLSLGVTKGISSSLSNLAGGEITEITKIIHDGRQHAFEKMFTEAKHYGGIGLGGITFDFVNHGGYFEFIAMGSTIHMAADHVDSSNLSFSTAANGQGLYCQKDAGFDPRSFVFSNIAYSIGVGGNIRGALRRLNRGEVPHYTEIFSRTRHLTLERIKNEAKLLGANAVIGIETSIMPIFGAQEMMMLGTAAHHPKLNDYSADPVTSDMTNEELWNIVSLGYLPLRLVIGVSVYSLGIVSGMTSIVQRLIGGKIHGLTEILYEAREKALARIQEDAQQCNADEIIGVKTRVYDLGGGLVEFMVMGTAVKKIADVKTQNENLLPQAIIQDKDTFIESVSGTSAALNKSTIASARTTQAGPISIITGLIFVAIYVLALYFK